MDKLEKVIQAFENCTAPVKCRDCPWEDCDSADCKRVDIPLSMAMAALELLKAQEPRVMTLEEVKSNEVVYLEDFADPDDFVEPIIRPAVNIEVENGGIVMLDSATWDEGFIFNIDDDYAKVWRCWTACPTEKQRKAVKWE